MNFYLTVQHDIFHCIWLDEKKDNRKGVDKIKDIKSKTQM